MFCFYCIHKTLHQSWIGVSLMALRNQKRVEITQNKIFKAVVYCLDEFGYHETSINKVLKYSGISRGALTHHYGTKESMIVETVERILDPVRGTRTLGKPPINKIDERNTENLRNNLIRLWVNVVNTPEGRALVEILIIARTDNTLFEKIKTSLKKYNAEINANISSIYEVISSTEIYDLQLNWTICRTFMRGLHIHARFEEDDRIIEQMMERFADIMAPHFKQN